MRVQRFGQTNATEVSTPSRVILFSYQTPVAAKVRGEVYVTKTFYSVTTSRHINRWCGQRRAIKWVDQRVIDRMAGEEEIDGILQSLSRRG